MKALVALSLLVTLKMKQNASLKRAFIGLASSRNCKSICYPIGCLLLRYDLRELRLELNIARNSVWDLTYPAFFPSPPEGLESQSEAVWYFYLAEIALRRLGNRILNYIYQCKTPQTSSSAVTEAMLNFEQQANTWSVLHLLNVET